MKGVEKVLVPQVEIGGLISQRDQVRGLKILCPIAVRNTAMTDMKNTIEAPKGTMKEGGSVAVTLAGVTINPEKKTMLKGELILSAKFPIRNITATRNLFWNQVLHVIKKRNTRINIMFVVPVLSAMNRVVTGGRWSAGWTMTARKVLVTTSEKEPSRTRQARGSEVNM